MIAAIAYDYAEYTHHRESIIVWLTSCLTGLHLTKQVNLKLIQHSQKAAKSKQNKQEVGRAVILSPMVSVLWPMLNHSNRKLG